MDQFFILQVRINLLQQNIASLQRTDFQPCMNLIHDLVTLSTDVLNLDNEFLRNEYTPQIDHLYSILINKVDTFIPIEQ